MGCEPSKRYRSKTSAHTALFDEHRQIKEAKIEAEYLIEVSSEAKDLDLASNPYLYSGEFKKAIELLNKAYVKSSNEDVLIRMVSHHG